MNAEDKKKETSDSRKPYCKPALRNFGNVRYTTKTDPMLMGGDDFVMGFDLWGDPS